MPTTTTIITITSTSTTTTTTTATTTTTTTTTSTTTNDATTKIYSAFIKFTVDVSCDKKYKESIDTTNSL